MNMNPSQFKDIIGTSDSRFFNKNNEMFILIDSFIVYVEITLIRTIFTLIALCISM
jgi:hypothetical protein